MRGPDLRRSLSSPHESLAALGAKVLFLTALGLAILLTAMASSPVVIALGAFLSFVALSIILPTDRIRAALVGLWSGEAGESAVQRLRGRFAVGLPAAVAVALLVATVSPALGGGAVGTAQAASPTCSSTTQVTHDKFLTDNESVDALVNGSTVRSRVANTQVTVEESTAFVRINAENPNGYCVDVTVKIADRAIPSAELPGTVESNNGTVEAEWESIYDWNESRSYTVVNFTLTPGQQATFAPSSIRVRALSWASERTSKGEGLLDNLTRQFEDNPDLKSRHLTLRANETPKAVSVPLTSPDGDSQIEDWQALYTTDDGETWQPVGEESNAPVYKTYPDDEHVRFHFTEADTRVKFTANPTMTEQLDYQAEANKAGLDRMLDSLSNLLGGDN